MEKTSSVHAGVSRSAYVFGGFRLELDGTLLRGNKCVEMPPKQLAVLRLLVSRAGQVVTFMQLRQALGEERSAPTGQVSHHVAALNERLQPETFIESVYKRGYRFIAPVRTNYVEVGKALPRLAILPFAVAPGIAEYVGFTVAEETMQRLRSARHPAAHVLACDSIFALSRRNLGAQQIGAMLGADLALTATVDGLPAHYRLRAAMLRVEDGSQLWTEDLLVERSRLAGLESELANRIAYRLLDGGLTISASAADPEDTPYHQEAYELYQRAHHEWQTLQRHQMQDGLQRLQHAIELDPALTEARVDLAHLCIAESFYGFMAPMVAADMVRRAAGPTLAPTLRGESLLPALGWIRFHVDRDLPAALWAFSRSSHLAHDPWITRVRTMFALSRHRFDEAIEILREAIEDDPYAPWLQARLGWTLHLQGKTAASVTQIEHALELTPEHESTCLYGSLILAYNGQTERATRLAQELTRRCPYFDLATAAHAYALACTGHTSEARATLERLQWLSRERFVLNSFTPAVYATLGDHDAALEELRIADQARCPWFFQMLADPRLEPLHARPEFTEMQSALTEMEAAAEADAGAEFVVN